MLLGAAAGSARAAGIEVPPELQPAKQCLENALRSLKVLKPGDPTVYLQMKRKKLEDMFPAEPNAHGGPLKEFAVVTDVTSFLSEYDHYLTLQGLSRSSFTKSINRDNTRKLYNGQDYPSREVIERFMNGRFALIDIEEVRQRAKFNDTLTPDLDNELNEMKADYEKLLKDKESFRNFTYDDCLRFFGLLAEVNTYTDPSYNPSALRKVGQIAIVRAVGAGGKFIYSHIKSSFSVTFAAGLGASLAFNSMFGDMQSYLRGKSKAEARSLDAIEKELMATSSEPYNAGSPAADLARFKTHEADLIKLFGDLGNERKLWLVTKPALFDSNTRDSRAFAKQTEAGGGGVINEDSCHPLDPRVYAQLYLTAYNETYRIVNPPRLSKDSSFASQEVNDGIGSSNNATDAHIKDYADKGMLGCFTAVLAKTVSEVIVDARRTK
jgi:hypothetical protein